VRHSAVEPLGVLATRDCHPTTYLAHAFARFKSELVSRLLELTSVQERSLVDSRDSHDLTTANLYWHALPPGAHRLG